MKPDDELDVLREQSLSLEKAIGDIDHEIGYRLPLMNIATDPDGTVSFLRDRYEIRGQHLFTLGKVTAQIEIAPFEEVNEAMAKVNRNEARYRIVLAINDALDQKHRSK